MIDFRRRAGAGAFAALTVLTLAACSSSKPAAPQTSSSSTPPSQSASSGGTSSGAPSSGAPSSGAPSSGAADAQTTAAVKDAYAKVFNSKTPEAESLSLLQDGQQFKATVEAQAKSSLAQGASATVSSVTLQSPNTAKVIFTLSISGSAVLPNTSGYAVRENGTWKVAGSTFCALLTMQNSAPPACQTAAATSLPN